MNSFTRSVDLLQRALDVNTLRYSVAANNMANADVPNFKRTKVNFESELKRAFESEERAKNAFELKTSEPYHIKINNVIDYQSVEPRRVTDYLSTEKANGGIGIIPFIYKDACNYYYNLYLAQEANENKEIKEQKVKEITIVSPQAERKKIKLFSFENEEQERRNIDE